MRTMLVTVALALFVSATHGAEYKDVTFRNELGKGKHGYLHMPAFDSIKELTCPCFIPEAPTNMIGPSMGEEPYATLQKIIEAKRSGDLEAEYALSTPAFVEAKKPYSDAMRRLNDGWKHMSSIQFVASTKVDQFEWFFLKCSSGPADGYEAILLTLADGKYRQACPDSREASTKLNYVHSAFVTGAWVEKGQPSGPVHGDTARTLADPRH